MMKSSDQKPKSFLFKLGKFCNDVDSKVSELKVTYENIPGSKPQNYDKGLNIFKSELQNLKTLSDDAKLKIGEVQQFSFFTASLQEMVSQQEDDILKMENYLKKFGYEVPEFLEKQNDENFSFMNEIIHTPFEKEANMLNTDEKEPSSSLDIGPPMTPELSDVGKLVLQGKRLPIIEILADNNGKAYNPTVTTISTPTCTKSLRYDVTPISSSVKNIQNWLANVHADASFTITPNVVTQNPVKLIKRRNFQQIMNSNESDRKLGLTGNELSTKINNFSYEKENIRFSELLGKPNRLLQRSRYEGFKASSLYADSTSDKEQPFYSTLVNGNDFQQISTAPNLRHDNFSLRESQNKRFTPEEPILSTARNTNVKINHPTPEEPVLSSACNVKIGNVVAEEYFTPEEPSLNCEKGFCSVTKSSSVSLADTPQSPQLSDVTRKILNIRSLRFSVPDSEASLPDEEQPDKRIF